MARLENSEIAALFNEMADLLHIQGGDRHRVSAFRRAARLIEGLPRPAEELLGHNELDKVRGIGAGTVRRVKQMLRSHTCDDLEALRRKVPGGLREMVEIRGIGATTVRNLHNRLGVENIEQLEYAAKLGRIETVPGMGSATANKILAGIDAYRQRRGKVALIDAQRVGRRIAAALSELPVAERVALAGSVRRNKATIGDLDILVATRDPIQVSARFQTLPDVEAILLGGEGRCSVRLRNQQQADLRLLPPANFGAGLHYFTGSKSHNIELRKRGNKMGIKVSDKGVFIREPETLVDGCAEEDAVFRYLGLAWIPPELRENDGEIEAAERGRLPQLICSEELLGDLHMHSTDSDGTGSLREMAERGRELGHQYIAITDHSKALRIANGLDEARLAAQLQRIRQLDGRIDGIRVLAGIEVDILEDGALDLDSALLAQLDWVVASVHQWTAQSVETMTARVVRAIESGVVDCIGHPTGRQPGKRDAYPIDLEAVIASARAHAVALECNGGPNRMDLGDIECRRCRERGVAVVINTDAHAPGHLGRHEYGLAMARRGWLERKHVLNAQPWSVIAERRARRLRDHGDRSWRVSPVIISVPQGLELAPARLEAEPLEPLEPLDPLDHAWDETEAGSDADPTSSPEPAVIDPPVAVSDAGVTPRPLADPESDRQDLAQHEAVSDAGVTPRPLADPESDRQDVAQHEAVSSAGVTPRPLADPESDRQVSPEQIAELVERLAAPLDEPLQDRLRAWLMSGVEDPTLERALEQIAADGNPLQIGFDLLTRD